MRSHIVVPLSLLLAGFCCSAVVAHAEIAVPHGHTRLRLEPEHDRWLLLPSRSTEKQSLNEDALLEAAGFHVSPGPSRLQWITPAAKSTAINVDALPEDLRTRLALVAGLDGVTPSETRWIAVLNRVSVHFDALPSDPAAWLAGWGLVDAAPHPSLPGVWTAALAHDAALGESLRVAERLRAQPGVATASAALLRPMAPRFVPDDPFFPDQWALNNTGQHSGAAVGNDANLVPAWDSATGADIVIGVIDEGIDQAHDDLAGNLLPELQLDVEDDDTDPSPGTPGKSHGTSVAGIAAALGNNTLGICGTAFDAGLVGIRYEGIVTTRQDHATALAHTVMNPVESPHIDIFNMSYGPLDDGRTLDAPGDIELLALATGATQGRGGKGAIYVWAAGNGRLALDDANYDGFASSIYVIGVAASGAGGVVAPYSEPGSSVLINAPSDYSTVGGSRIVSTANGNFYTTTFGGTSAATPVVAGVVALALERNPALTARDMQHLLIQTAQKNDPGATSWITNAAGHSFSRDYGFGRVDAAAVVDHAPDFRHVPPWTEAPLSAEESVGVGIPDDDPNGITRTLRIDAPAGFVVERVVARVSATHTFRGDLAWSLSSPSGTTVLLAGPRADEADVYDQWPLASVATWGESAQGDWTLRVVDSGAFDTGTFDAWALEIYGYQIAHSADQDADHRINLTELLRLIQFYNLAEFHCEAGTEDGYAPGVGAQTCTPHDNDYAPQDWTISLGELLRAIQLYNIGGYLPCESGEDGFCPVAQ